MLLLRVGGVGGVGDVDEFVCVVFAGGDGVGDGVASGIVIIDGDIAVDVRAIGGVSC